MLAVGSERDQNGLPVSVTVEVAPSCSIPMDSTSKLTRQLALVRPCRLMVVTRGHDQPEPGSRRVYVGTVAQRPFPPTPSA